MRILLTADTVGGVWTYALELARALNEHNVEVALATMGALPIAEQRVQLDDLADTQLYASSFKLEWMNDPWESVRWAGEWLLRLEERVRPDIVHLNNYAHGALPWSAPVLIVGHSCVLSWWAAVKQENAPANWDRYRQEVTMGLRHADLVLAPSEHMLTQLNLYYGPFQESGVVLNGRDPRMFLPGKKEPFIFAAGRVWDEAKNIAALETVAPRLSWPVYVAGEEEHPDGTSKGHSNIRGLGKVAPQAVPAWFAKAAIYAHPARYEPFGLSALEAALAGCALVLGDVPSLREIWKDSALFVPPDNTTALADALNMLISNDSHRAGLAELSRERALALSPQRMALGYLDAYRDLIYAQGSKPHRSFTGDREGSEPQLPIHAVSSEESDCA